MLFRSLNIEIGLARGVSKESIETEDYSFRGILAHLAIAEWEGRKIDPFESDRSGRLKMIGKDRRNGWNGRKESGKAPDSFLMDCDLVVRMTALQKIRRMKSHRLFRLMVQ